MLDNFLFMILISIFLATTSVYTFGKMFGGSKDTEIYLNWSKQVNDVIAEGRDIIDSFKELSEKDTATLEEYRILDSRFESINIDELNNKEFNLKGKEKDDSEKLQSEFNLFIDDFSFFKKELESKISKFERLEKLNKELDSYMITLSEIESKQQLLARTIPRINTNAELEMVTGELTDLKKILPTKIESDPIYPEDTQIRIERTNLKLAEWYNKLEFIQNSIAKRKGKIESTVQEQEQKQNLSKVHTWLDSSETRLIKITDKIKKISELVTDESTSSRILVNSLKELEKTNEEINEIKPPEVELIGEKQTKIGIDFRIKELNRLVSSLQDVQNTINQNISYRISFIRSTILEKMFMKTHQISYSQVNYSLGYKNELLLQGWLSSPGSEKFVLKNFQNKYLMLSKENISSLKESSEKIFESLQALTDFERTTSDQSYTQSIKWLLANDDKWFSK